jgi:hypothetical protein
VLTAADRVGHEDLIGGVDGDAGGRHRRTYALTVLNGGPSEAQGVS